MNTAPTPPLLGICAYGSGIGKTTLLSLLIPQLMLSGLRISVIKHAHHSFDIDHPGKDSYRLREAGAVQTMIGSRQRWALMTELKPGGLEGAEPDLHMLVAQLDYTMADLVLVEGFRHADIAKIEVNRAALHTPLLALQDASIIAIATDDAQLQASAIVADLTATMLDINDIPAIAGFILHWLKLQPSATP